MAWVIAKNNEHLRSRTPSIAFPHETAVITGIGIVSPIGHSKQEFWSQLHQGISGIDFIQKFDTSKFPCKFGAEIRGLNVRDYLSRAQVAYYSSATQFTCVALRLAKEDARTSQFDPERTDVIIGAAGTAFDYIDGEMAKRALGGDESFDPSGITKLTLNSAAAAIASQEHISGKTQVVSTACASGLTAIATAMERIQLGLSDTAIVGAADIGVTQFLLGLFSSAKMVSFEQNSANRAVLPFDRNRTRSVLGDGACILIVERETTALERGARIYARLASFAQELENVNGLFQPDLSGVRWGKTIRRAVELAGGNIDYINAHATGDIVLDQLEAQALSRAFNGSLDTLLVSSIKGAVGSPLSAAGPLQTATAALAIAFGSVPPCQGFLEADPEIPIHTINKVSTPYPVRRALINSRGVGGLNASLVLEHMGMR